MTTSLMPQGVDHSIHWQKAEGDTPEGEVLAVNKNGDVLIGFLNKYDRRGKERWTCACPAYAGDYNEYLDDVCWYIKMDKLLASVPKE